MRQRRAHRHEDATKLELVLPWWIDQFPRKTASVLTTQSRYESRFAQEDDLTSPTIMAIARTKGYTVKTDIFQVEQISNNHPCWCWVLSLSTGTVLYSSCMDTTTTTYSSSSQGSETNKELSNQVCTPPTATLGFFCLQQGPAFVRAGSLISTLMTSFRKEAETM